MPTKEIKPAESLKPSMISGNGDVVYVSQEERLLQLLRAGFKLGAIFGFTCAKDRKHRTTKQLIAWLETPEAQVMINQIVKEVGP